MAASSSSSSSVDSGKYDVFLSFRGDTRDNFTSHLHTALVRRGIRTFIDYRIDRGEELEQSLVEAIRESSISVIIFSEKYADSRWCLNELVECMKRKKQGKQKVLPIFYKVDPADVKHQTRSFGEAFKKYEEDVKVDKNKIQEWRTSLNEAAYLCGWDSKNTGPESILVEEIVKDILKKLGHPCLDYVEDLVGIQSQIENVESLLQIGTPDIRIVGLWGMGGIGKTTIARVIFDKSYCHFEGCCFVENVREESTKHGLTKLRDEILVNVLNEGNTSMSTSNSRPSFVRKQLRHVRALIVLDDVDTFEQVEALAGKHTWFGAGSRIIITSRDKQVFQDGVDETYKVQALTHQESLELFSLCAFKERQPEGDMMGLSKKVISYVEGVPLGLKVLGVFLYRKSKIEWESALSKLEKTPHVKIQDVLKTSYQGLDFDEQQTFLHMACFLKGVSIFDAEKLLDACGFHTSINLRVLADKCLVDISNNMVEMHDLVQEMGRQIVREESLKEPGKRSRLWDYEDICHVLTKNTASEAIEAMLLDKSKLSGLCLSPTAFAKMKQIKLLILCGYGCEHDIHLPQGLESLPDELRHFQWNFYPLKSLPSNFHPDNPDVLDMSESQIERLWTGIQDLSNLKAIILDGCKNLIELPDLSGLSNLEKINCQDSVCLTEVPASIANLDKLVDMNFRHCRKITSVPCRRSIKCIDLLGCSNHEKFPEVGDIKYLEFTGTIFEGESSATALHHGNIPSDISQVNFAYKWKITETCIYIIEITCTWDENNFQRASIWPEELDLIKRTRLPQLQGYAKVDNQGELERHSIGICHHDSFPFFNHSKLEQEKIADFWHVIYQRIQFVGAALLFPKEISTFPLGSFGCYHQSEGSSITIQLPQNWLRDEFVGFTVLAILSLEDSNGSDDYFYSRWECQFNSACGESKRVSIQLRHLPFEYGSSYFTSETQLVSDDWLYESEWNKATFDAYLETSCAKPCYKLKYILIRLMYIGDVVENPPVTQPSYSYDPSKMSLTFSFNKAEGTSIGRDLDDYHNDEKDNGKRRFDAEGTERQVIVSSPHSKEQNKGKDKILTTQGTQQSSSNQMCISNKLRKDESIEEEDEVESGYSEDHEAQEETLFMDTVVDHHFLNSTSYNHSFNTVDAQSCVFKSLAPSLECEASSSSGQAPFCILEDASLEQFNNPLESLDLSFLDLTSVVPSFTSLEEPSSPEEVEPAKTKLMEILTIKLPDLSVEQRDVALGAIKILLRSPSHTLEVRKRLDKLQIEIPQLITSYSAYQLELTSLTNHLDNFVSKTTRARELTEKIKAARERDQELRNRILKLQGQINMLYEEIDILKQEAYSNKNLADTIAQEWHANSKDLQTLAASIETECPMAQKWSHQRQQVSQLVQALSNQWDALCSFQL